MSPRRLAAVLIVELRALVARPATWVWLFSTLCVSLVIASAMGLSVLGTARRLASISLLDAFFVAVAAGLAVIRDDEHNLGDLIHSTPLRPSEYVLGKLFAVAGVFTCGVLVRESCVTAISSLLRGPTPVWQEFDRVLLSTWVPMMCLMAGACFAVGERARQTASVFFPPVLTLVLCTFVFWPSNPWIDSGLSRLLALLDPTGLRWLGEIQRRLPSASLPWDGAFVASRAALVLAGVLAVAGSIRHIPRAMRGGRTRRRPSTAATGAASSRVDRLSFGRVPAVHVVSTIAAMECRELLRQPAFYLFGPFLVVFFGLVVYNDFFTRSVITAGMLATALHGLATIYSCLLLTVTLVESLDRERRHGTEPLLHTTPVSTAALLSGKALASACLVFGLLLVCLFVCLAGQAIQGLSPLQVWPYVQVWGLVMLPSLLLCIAFVVAVYAVSRSRWTTYVVSFSTIAVSSALSATGSLTWATNWLLTGNLLWTDFGSFDVDRSSLILNRVTALAFVPWLAWLAARAHRRRVPDAIGRAARTGRGARLLLAGLAAVPLVLVAVLQVRVWSGFEGPFATSSAKLYWRRNVNTYGGLPLPSLAAADLDVALFPDSRRIETSGSYVLENRLDRTLDQIPLTVRPHLAATRWTLDGRPIQPENRHGLCVIHHSLAPGARVRVGFELEGELWKGSSRMGTTSSVYFSSRIVFLPRDYFSPTLGFEPGLGIDIGNRSDPSEPLQRVALPNRRFASRIRITGPDDLEYGSLGDKVGDSRSGGRRTTIWESVGSIPSLHVVAGRWQRFGASGRVFLHPAHGMNAEELSRALETSGTHYSNWFGASPWAHTRLYEIPGPEDAMAQPGHVLLFETLALNRPGRSLRSRGSLGMVVAHEVAHQWWGHLIRPSETPGGGMLGEGLANLSVALYLAETEGDARRMAFMEDLEQQYLMERQADSEKPLFDLAPQHARFGRIIRTRGAWALWMLRDVMGHDAFLAGLKSYVARYREHPSRPLVEDFLAVLREHTENTEASDACVRQWIQTADLPEYRLGRAEKARQADGTWRVRCPVRNVGGLSSPVSIAASRGARTPDNSGYEERRLTLAMEPGVERVLTFECPFEPTRIVIDPDVNVLQRGRRDARLAL